MADKANSKSAQEKLELSEIQRLKVENVTLRLQNKSAAIQSLGRQVPAIKQLYDEVEAASAEQRALVKEIAQELGVPSERLRIKFDTMEVFLAPEIGGVSN